MAANFFVTPPLQIIDYPADQFHFTPGRQGFDPEYIAMHHTGGVNSLPWLTRTSQPAVSAHRLITRKGHNLKLVQDEDTAYCAGFAEVGPIDPDTNDPRGIAANFNLVSLNIELENRGNGEPYPFVQMQMAAWQVVEWWSKYRAFLPVVSHAQVDERKHDPFGFDWPLFWQLCYQRIESVLA